MKAILEFELPEDQQEFNFATQGSDWWNVCWQMDVWLRATIKYAPDTISDDEYKTYERCKDQLRELINSQGLNLDQ